MQTWKLWLKRRGRWFIVAIGAVLVLLLLATGFLNGTFSYFHAKDAVENEMGITTLTFDIEEPHWKEPPTPVKPGDVIEKDPQIKNTGYVDFVTRVRVEEVWTLKTDSTQILDEEDHVRYYSTTADTYSLDALVGILNADKGKEENDKQFKLIDNLNATASGWYRGEDEDSEYFYYNQVLSPAEASQPIFRAVTIRTAEDYCGADITDEQRQAYNKKLADYDLQIIVYGEVVEAKEFAWRDLWDNKNDIPQECEKAWLSQVST